MIEYLKEHQYERVTKKKNLDEFTPDQKAEPNTCDKCNFTHYIHKEIIFDPKHKEYKLCTKDQISVSLQTNCNNIELIQVEFGNRATVTYSIQILRLLKQVVGTDNFVNIPCLQNVYYPDCNITIHVFYKTKSPNKDNVYIKRIKPKTTVCRIVKLNHYKLIDLTSKTLFQLIKDHYYVPDHFSKQFTVRNGTIHKNILSRTGSKPMIIQPRQRCWTFFHETPVNYILEIKSELL